MNHIQFNAVETRINQILTNQLISIENMETKPGINIDEFETLLWSITKKVNDRIELLDPNKSGQVDEIYQLENIQSFLNEVNSEFFIYVQKKAKGKYTNQD